MAESIVSEAGYDGAPSRSASFKTARSSASSRTHEGKNGNPEYDDGGNDRIGLVQAVYRCFLPGLEESQKDRRKRGRIAQTICAVLSLALLLLPAFGIKFYLASNEGQEVVLTLLHTCWDEGGKQE